METILIIEDTSQLRESIAEVLTNEGFRVLQADNGLAGIVLAIENMPDLILCDIMMPEADGFEVLNALKSDQGQLEAPFIFITALEDRKNVREGMERGADDYLIKPFTIEELLRTVNVRLEKRRSMESRFHLRIEAIERELQAGIEELNNTIGAQKSLIEKVAGDKELADLKLKEKQDQLMEDALRSIAINSTLQDMSAQLTHLLQKELPDDQRKTLIDLRNRLRNKSILLNNQTVFLFKFEQTYPNFKQRLLLRNPKLKKQELVLLAASYIHLDTQQMGTILNITAESVRKKRYRLKQKMGSIVEQELSDLFGQTDNRPAGLLRALKEGTD